MKANETEIRFKTGFQQPKTGFAKKPVLTSLLSTVLDLDRKTSQIKLWPLFHDTSENPSVLDRLVFAVITGKLGKVTGTEAAKESPLSD